MKNKMFKKNNLPPKFLKILVLVLVSTIPINSFVAKSTADILNPVDPIEIESIEVGGKNIIEKTAQMRIIEGFNQTTLKLCNFLPTEDSVIVAIAFSNGDSRGWYEIEPSSCETIPVGRYEGEIFYYATDHKNRTWQGEEGKQSFCINLEKEFNFSNQSNCQGDNLTKVKMKAIRVELGNIATVEFE